MDWGGGSLVPAKEPYGRVGVTASQFLPDATVVD